MSKSSRDHTILRTRNTRHFYIKGASDPLKDKLVFLEESILIGRSDECDMVVDVEGISRRHARIEVRDKGCILIDEGSSNGTFLNGNRIDKAELQDGDEISLDDTKFQFKEIVPRTSQQSSGFAPASNREEDTQSSGGWWWWLIAILGILLAGILLYCWFLGC